MCKFTTIILLLSISTLLSTQVTAQNTDISVLKSINSVEQTVSFSRFVSNTTTAVGPGVPVVLGVVACINKDDAMLKNAVAVGSALVVDAALTYSLKKIVNRPRPYVTYPTDIIPYSSESSMSFPSGHTSFAFATATSLSIKYPRWYVIAPSYLWAGAVGYSRMNLGVHYPSDVLAGAMLGAGSAWLTCKVNDWYWQQQGNKPIITGWEKLPVKE
jgi:membrane-associated phospholipid phosphatase